MPKVLRPIGHDDRLTVIDHLDELRTRLFVCVGVLLIAFGICFWQNHALLDVLNRALPLYPKTSANHLSGLTNDSVKEARALNAMSRDFSALAASTTQHPADRARFTRLAHDTAAAARSLPQSDPRRLPITIGIGEPFTTTLTISAYFALLFSLPVLLWQGYAFVLPALTAEERRVALPMMSMAPVLFVLGVVFSFFIVLPPAVRFLQGFNSGSFDILLQAKPYYTFEVLTMLGVGLAFQLPIGMLALQRLGVINASTLIRHWRYAVVIIAVIAAALPGPDPVTTALETLPLFVLYGLSIVLLKIADRRAAAREAAQASDLQHLDDSLDPTQAS
jgi:sec-independent protein translocase protein TatC